MAIVSKFMMIGMILFSIAAGFLSFYLFSDLTKDGKKIHIEELTAQFINFIIFIWIGKILLNLSGFIADPLSVLAYPSDSKAFYVAVGMMALWLLYKSKRKGLKVLPFLESFVHVFLIGSFVYEFIQVVFHDNSYAFASLVLLAILIGLYFFLRGRITVPVLLMVVVTVWSIGMMLLVVLQPFVTVFGYMMSPWFIGVFFALSISGLIYMNRREVI